MTATDLICWICKATVESDDVAFAGERPICLTCWNREVGDKHPMTKELRDAVTRAAEQKT